MKEGEDIYKMAKGIERKTCNIIQIKWIKDEVVQLLRKVKEIRTYGGTILTLFNEDNGSSSIELYISSDDLNGHFA
jgi:hypothetical protein